ncbi:MAG: spermidine synthase [Reyranella sp.]|nr:spermidine synthase [Reyranella sp.]
MSVAFEELDFCSTPIGTLSLRRRRPPGLEADVYEIKLDDEFLMSSLFTVAEIALARLGLAGSPGKDIDVIVGGLGLGYTAQAVLEHPVRSLAVIEALAPVIRWHEQGLLPLGARLTADPRCRLVRGDFFAIMKSALSGDDDRRVHAILVDIDHSPRKVLHPDHVSFYEVEGLCKLATHLRPGGVFGLWSDDPPDAEFVARLATVFAKVDAHVVAFHNPLQDRDAANTVYVASTANQDT